MSDPEPSPKPKQTWAAWWGNVSNAWKNASVIGGLAGLLALSFTGGRAVGEGNSEQKVLFAKNECLVAAGKVEREARTKEDELRQCFQSNASLQAILKLNEADRNRLLDSAATLPSLKLTIDGQSLAGRHEVKAVARGDATSLEAKIWIENTGTRDVKVDGFEFITAAEWWVEGSQYNTIDGTELERDPSKKRYWAELNWNLSPGARRYVPVTVGHFGPKPHALTVSSTVLASGFLPLKIAWDIAEK